MDREATFEATRVLAEKADLTFAQFVMLTPFCGTVDFEKWETSLGDTPPEVAGIPLTRYWLIPAEQRPKMFMPHPTMSSEEMRQRTQGVWDQFYSNRGARPICAPVWRSSSFRNCTDRCTPARELRPTARGEIERPRGRGSWRYHAVDYSGRARCLNCRFQERVRAWQRPRSR